MISKQFKMTGTNVVGERNGTPRVSHVLVPVLAEGEDPTLANVNVLVFTTDEPAALAEMAYGKTYTITISENA